MRYWKFFVQILSLYFISGVFFVWYNFFKNFSVLHLLNAIFPALAFISVSFFFLYTGFSCIKANNEMKIIRLISIALLIQTVQFTLFGFVFANYFGPCVFIGFYFEPTIKFDINISVYSWLFSNGYSENAQSKFFINLIPLLLLLLLKGMKRNLN